ncbi:hypothetical protein G7Z17_g6448 [Cylindrodendrum hubeiense]|uniref:HTH APSES-type domain-containing protein n=1 Tax=Cylindrodendrum hubeiense TaxID=595255 RepID=A0A9P5H4Q2_9HYPO|nr:hypothetical protein G7Z17_g6448 [Cylindrodendrum hubeiense]
MQHPLSQSDPAEYKGALLPAAPSVDGEHGYIYGPKSVPAAPSLVSKPLGSQNVLPLPGDSIHGTIQSDGQGFDTTGQQPSRGMNPHITATLWEDEDNRMINGTKLLNVAGITRTHRDAVLKSEKARHVVKIGPMHLKGVWIPYNRALDFANTEKITPILYPLYKDLDGNIRALDRAQLETPRRLHQSEETNVSDVSDDAVRIAAPNEDGTVFHNYATEGYAQKSIKHEDAGISHRKYEHQSVRNPGLSAEPWKSVTDAPASDGMDAAYLSKAWQGVAADNMPAQATLPPKTTPTKSALKALPTVRDHTTDQINSAGDEYLPREADEFGEKKVGANGTLQGGREYKCRTFLVPNRGDKLFMLATECARVLNYRDSYLLFEKNKSLLKIIASVAEKDDLIQQEIIPFSYRSRLIAIVAARSMFRQFGSRVIMNGRRVRDDYWETNARKRGFTEADIAGEKRPGATEARKAAEAAHNNILLAGPYPQTDSSKYPGLPSSSFTSPYSQVPYGSPGSSLFPGFSQSHIARPGMIGTPPGSTTSLPGLAPGSDPSDSQLHDNSGIPKGGPRQEVPGLAKQDPPRPSPFSELNPEANDATESSRYLKCDGEFIKITTNCEAALVRLRQSKDVRVLWVDAVCIDQSNDEERSLQIPLMGQIYSQATWVGLWLGEASSTVDEVTSSPLSELGMSFIHDFAVEIAERSNSGQDILEGELYQEFIKDWKAFQEQSTEEVFTPRVRGFWDVLHRPWWERLWAVQELALAQSPILMCGGSTEAWHNLMVVIDALVRSDDIPEAVYEFIATFITSAFHQIRMRSFVDRHEPDSNATEPLVSGKKALEILNATRNTRASDPRDKIYGILGFFGNVKSDPENIFPQPDYSKTVAELYAGVARSIITNTGSLDVLSSCYGFVQSTVTDLPSWAAAWNDTPLNFFPDDCFNAASGSSVVYEDSGDNWYLLRVKGRRVDYVKYPSPVPDELEYDNQIMTQLWRQWADLGFALQSYPTGEALADVFMHTLCWGSNLKFNRLVPGEYRETFDAWIKILRSTDTLEVAARNIFEDQTAYTYSRRASFLTLARVLGRVKWYFETQAAVAKG